MSTAWRIYGAEMSPYSVKVRAYFRYKGIAHDWIVRSGERMAEFDALAKLPLIPLVVDPDGVAAQDSTPVIESVEARHPQPSIHPEDPVAAFASALLEEYGDEWGNKWMFHLRWAREADQLAGASRIARTIEPDADEARHLALAAQVRERMVGRVGFVGSNAGTAPIIEASFLDALRLLETHLAARTYLFGARPAFADFALWAQVRSAFTDPTGYGIIANRTPGVLEWLARMEWPRADGPFEDWASLEPTLGPLLRAEVAARFLPWSIANAAALEAGRQEFTVALADGPWTQAPQKYHARSLARLRERHLASPARAEVDAMLAKWDCLALLVQDERRD